MTDKPQAPEDQSSATPADLPVDADDSATVDPTTVDSTTAETSSASPQKAAKQGPNWAAFFLVLILLTGIGGLAYYQWLQRDSVEETVTQLNATLETQSDRISDVAASQENLGEQLQAQRTQEAATAEALREQNRELSRQVDGLEQQLTRLRQRVQAISTTTAEDWRLAEAHYLTRLAGQRLLVERDTGGAVGLLQAADDIVRDYAGPELRPIRSALANDMSALKQVERVDREGLYLRIDALSRQIADLPVAERLDYQLPLNDQQSETDEAQTSGIWASIRRSFHNALAKLQSFVRVSHHDEPPRPLLSADHQLSLRASLQTALETAQLALLRGQGDIYQASLDKAADLLRELYADSEQRANLLAELDALKNTAVVQSLPEIGAAEQALANYLEQRRGQAGQDAVQEEAQVQQVQPEAEQDAQP